MSLSRIGKYELMNPEKVERALNGSSGSTGELIGGVGGGAYFDGVWKKDGEELSEKEVEVLEAKLLIEYDRIGGFIKQGIDKVATGSFYNVKAKKAHIVPEVKFEYRVNDRLVFVPENEPAPLAVRAQRMIDEESREEEVGEEAPAAKKSWKKKTV